MLEIRDFIGYGFQCTEFWSNLINAQTEGIKVGYECEWRERGK